MTNFFCSAYLSEISVKSLIPLLTSCFTYRYIYVPMGGSQSSLLGMLFSTALTFAFVSYWHGGQSYLWYWGTLNWLGVIVENGVKRILSISVIQDLIVSWISLQFMFLFSASVVVWTCWLLVWFGADWRFLCNSPPVSISHNQSFANYQQSKHWNMHGLKSFLCSSRLNSCLSCCI